MIYGYSNRQYTNSGIGIGNFIPLKKDQSADDFWTTHQLGDNENQLGKELFFKDNIFAEQVFVLPDNFEFRIIVKEPLGGFDGTIKLSHLEMIKSIDLAMGHLLGMDQLTTMKAKDIGFNRDINIFDKFKDNYRFGLYKVGSKEWKATLKYRKELGYITDQQEADEANSISDANPLYFWWIVSNYDYYTKDNFAAINVTTRPHGLEQSGFKEPTGTYMSGSYLDSADLAESFLCCPALFFPKEILATLGHFESRSHQLGRLSIHDDPSCHPGDIEFMDIGSVAREVSDLPTNLPRDWVDISTLGFNNDILKYMNYGSLMSASYLSPRIKHITPESADIIAARCKAAALGFKYLKSSSSSGFEKARMDMDFNAIDDIQNVALNLGLILDSDSLSQALLQLERISFVPDEWTCEGTRYKGSGSRDTLCEIFRRAGLYASGSIANVPIGDIEVDLTCSNGTVVMTVTTRDGTTLTIRNQMDGVKNCEYTNDGTIIFCVFYLSVGASLIGTLIDVSENAIFTSNLKLAEWIKPTSLDFDKSGISLCTTSAFRLRKFLTKL